MVDEVRVGGGGDGVVVAEGRGEAEKVGGAEDGDGLGVSADLGSPGEAVLVEDVVLDDLDGREELDRGREQDGHGVEQLHGVGLAVAREVHEDDGVDVVAVAEVRDAGDAGEHERDDEHDKHKQAVELLRLPHALLDRDEQPDALVREHGRADEQRPRVRLEHGHLFGGPVRDELDGGLAVDVEQSEEDEDVGHQRTNTQLRDTSGQGDRDEDQHLQQEEEAQLVDPAVHDLQDLLQVLAHKDRVRRRKAELRQHEREQDGELHLLAEQLEPDVAVPGDLASGRRPDQDRETVVGNERERDNHQVGEKKPAVGEGFGQEDDPRAQESLQQKQEGLRRRHLLLLALAFLRSAHLLLGPSLVVLPHERGRIVVQLRLVYHLVFVAISGLLVLGLGLPVVLL